jgi:hypothetical protein
MRFPSASSEIDEEEADANGDESHYSKRRVRDGGQFVQVALEFIRECEVGKAFDDKDHSHDTEKIVHGRSGFPFRWFLFRFIPQPVHFSKC